jgi:hypothetical protein
LLDLLPKCLLINEPCAMRATPDGKSWATPSEQGRLLFNVVFVGEARRICAPLGRLGFENEGLRIVLRTASHD